MCVYVFVCFNVCELMDPVYKMKKNSQKAFL